MFAVAVVEPHADKAAVIANCCVKSVTTHVDFGRLRQREPIERFQGAGGIALMHRRHLRAHRGRHDKARFRHAERREDALGKNLPQPLARYAFDDLARPINVAAIFPALARIKQQRRLKRGARCGDDARLAMLLGKAIVSRVEEIVAKARDVQQQHPRRHIALGRTQHGLSAVIKALEDLQLRNPGRIIFCGRIEIELAVLHELQTRRAGDSLGC